MRRLLSIAVLLAAGCASFLLATGFTSSRRPVYLVRAIFDDASFAVPGEDVRIAGANVGSIQGLGVTAQKRAAVTLAINQPGFAPFHADAHCAIRPQSLIGEEYVDCSPGTSSTPALARVTQGPGTGSHLLAVTRTSSPIDSDIVQNISTQPVRQSLALILNELGTGLAARGADLNAVIRRANPALGHTDRVLQILARQNHVLARLAIDSDTVLAPLARARRHLAGFITEANRTSVASAQRASDIARTFHLFPSFLRQLRPLMADLGSLADQGTPLMTSLGQSASSVGREFANLTPFATRARTALVELGAAAQSSQAPLVASVPLAQRLLRLGASAKPSAALLDRLTASLDRTGAIEQLMHVLFSGAVAGNGFDSLGHFLRAEPLVSSCTNYATSTLPGCSSNFAPSSAKAAGVSPAAAPPAGHPDRVVSQAVRSAPSAAGGGASMNGLLSYLVGGRR